MMSTVYTWLIWNMKRDPVTGSVGVVDYRVRGTKETAQALYSAAVTLIADPASPGFIPYEDLTPEIVIGWVQAKLEKDKEPSPEMIYADLEKQLDYLLAPKEDNGTPWN